MSNGVCGGSYRRDPYPDRPDVSLIRYDSDQWTLSDGEGIIMGSAETFVEVKQ